MSKTFAEIISELPGEWEVREEQAEVFEKIDALLQKYDDILIEAPTGWGKSLLAITLAHKWGPAYVLTAEKVLQDQYVRDFPFAHVIKGKENYQCMYNPERNAGNAPCAIIPGFSCLARNACHYRKAWSMVDSSPIVIANYHVILQNRALADRPDPRPLAIFDECHAIEPLIYDQFSITYDPFLEERIVRLGEICGEKGIPVEALDRTLEFVQNADIETMNVDQLLDFYEAFAEAFEEIQSRLPAKLDERHPLAMVARALAPLRRYFDTFTMLSDAVDSGAIEDLVFERQRDTAKVVPVQIGPFLGELTSIGTQRIWMSATIGNFEVFAKMHGISNFASIRLDSLFPPENRPIKWCNLFGINYRFLKEEQNMRRLCDEIERIVRSHEGENGVIHAGTYRVAKAVAEYLTRRGYQVWSHSDSATRHGTLDGFRHNGGILVSPSLYQGIDLKDDLSRWQIIVKVPFDSLSSELVKIKKDMDPDWYRYRAALKVMQAYGRSVRHKDDWAVTYIIDSNFRMIEKYMSKWVMEALYVGCD